MIEFIEKLIMGTVIVLAVSGFLLGVLFLLIELIKLLLLAGSLVNILD